MEQTHFCYNCGIYKRYYTKGFCYFDKEPYGYCWKNQKITEKHETCEFWRTAYYGRGLHKRIAKKKLEECIIQIQDLWQLLCEDEGEK